MDKFPLSKNRRVLIIDDNRSIHDDFRKILSPATSAALDASETILFGHSTSAVLKVRFEVDSAYQGQEGVLLAKSAMEAGLPYAMAFVDIRMPPGWDGVETAQHLWAVDPDIQIVFCTAYSDYSWDEMFDKLALHDGWLILKKPFDTVEAVQMAHALTGKWWLHQQSRRKMEELETRVLERTSELGKTNDALAIEIADHERAEKTLRESDEKFHQLADNITDAFWIRSPDLRQVHYISPGFEKIWGRPTAELYADHERWADFVLLEDRPRVWSAFTALMADAPSLDIEYRIVRPDGGIRWIHVRGFQVRDTSNVLIRLVGIVADITERKLSEQAMRESEQRFSGAFEYAPIGVALVSPEGRWLKVNRALCDLVGYSEAGLLARTFQDITQPDDLAPDLENVRRLIAGEISSYQMEKRYVHARGHLVTVLLNVSLVRDPLDKPLYFISQIQDITERKRLETQLFQSQKLETVGKLAGGIAHEFNSILTAIIGQSELLLADLPPGSPFAKNATEISQAAGRAATLTRQLLAYGRKQFLQPECLDLNAILAGMESTLQHLISEGTDLRIIPAPGLHTVKADAGQIEQVIVNLVINASDAMLPQGRDSKLTLETANISFEQESVGRSPELKPGDYVMLAITDTGTGMIEEVKARLFEPFFTTKAVGQGTGLGLSTCYGIIKQSGGHISVYSELGHGTTFKIYLPRAAVETKILQPQLASPGLPHGTETILLVEDDPALREMAASLLQRLGYTVLAAANGLEALSLQQQREGHLPLPSDGRGPGERASSGGHIDLLFTDVVMPHMSGKELADRIVAQYPHTRILFTSAYTENAIHHQAVLTNGVAFLQKPFTPSALARKIREVLDQ